MIHTLTLYRNEIKFDIENKAFKYADTLDMSEKDRSRFDLRKNDTDWIDRCVDDAIGNINDMLGQFAVDVEVADNDVETERSWTLEYSTGKGWLANESVIRTLVHDYIAKYCLADWFNVFNLNLSATFGSQADTILRRIHGKINAYDIDTPRFNL